MPFFSILFVKLFFIAISQFVLFAGNRFIMIYDTVGYYMIYDTESDAL